MIQFNWVKYRNESFYFAVNPIVQLFSTETPRKLTDLALLTMVYMSSAIVSSVRRALNYGAILRAHPYIWNAENPFPEIQRISKVGGTLWPLNSALLFGYTAYLASEVWHFSTQKSNLVALISILFVLLMHAFGSVLQLTVIHEKAEIVDLVRKLCIHMGSGSGGNPKGTPKKPRLIVICEKILDMVFYAAVINNVITATTAAYQLDGSKLMVKMCCGSGILLPVVRIAFITLHLYMGYVLWSLTILLGLLFFAVAFTVMASLNQLLVQAE